MAGNANLFETLAVAKESNENGSRKTIEGSGFSREEQRNYIATCLGLAINDPKVNEILNGEDDK
jgi:hypothetical protein